MPHTVISTNLSAALPLKQRSRTVSGWLGDGGWLCVPHHIHRADADKMTGTSHNIEFNNIIFFLGFIVSTMFT